MRLTTEFDTLAALAAEAGRLEAEAEGLEKDMAKQGKLQAARLAEVEEQLEKARAVRDRLIAQHAEVLRTAEAEERQRLEAGNVSDQMLSSGAATAADYLAGHLEPGEIAAKAASAGEEKVSAIAAPIRHAALDVMRLELEVANVEFEIAFCKSAPLSQKLDVFKARLKAVEGAASIGLSGVAVTANRRQDLMRKVAIASGEAHMLGGLQLYDLNLDAVERLRFDPLIRDENLPALAEILSKLRAAGPDAKLVVLTIGSSGELKWRLG